MSPLAPTVELPEAWERPDLYLPVATETSPLPAESRVIVYSDPRSPGADRFRWAGMRLKSIQAARGVKTLLITSPLPGDGKSTVALNLATVLADKGKHPVLLVEADTYRPSILNKLGLRPWPGLSGVINVRVNRDWQSGESTRWGFICCQQGRPRGMATSFSSRALSRN